MTDLSILMNIKGNDCRQFIQKFSTKMHENVKQVFYFCFVDQLVNSDHLDMIVEQVNYLYDFRKYKQNHQLVFNCYSESKIPSTQTLQGKFVND